MNRTRTDRFLDVSGHELIVLAKESRIYPNGEAVENRNPSRRMAL